MALDCKKLIISQYQNSPKLAGLIESFCDIVQIDLIDTIDQLKLEMTVAKASGFFLDLIGERLDLKRPGVDTTAVQFVPPGGAFGFDGQSDSVGFDQEPFVEVGFFGGFVPVADDIYRKYLISRAGGFLTNGSQPDLSDVVATAFGDAIYLDGQDMTCIIVISGSTLDTILLATETGLIPKPAGVRIKKIKVVHPEGAFGFDGQSDSVGFDQAPFVGVI